MQIIRQQSTFKIAPLVHPSLFWITVCSLYRKPSDSRVLRCVSRVPAKLRLRVIYSFRTGSALISAYYCVIRAAFQTNAGMSSPMIPK